MAKRILRLPAVEDRSGLSRSTIYSRIAEGTFPEPVKLGPRASGWPEDEVDMVNAARIAGQSDDDIRALVAKLKAARTKAVHRFESDIDAGGAA